jgi:hypothetical protein
MKKTSLLLIGTLAASVAFPTSWLFAAKAEGANAKLLERYDSNKNGKLDPDEFAAVRSDFAAKRKNVLAKLDTDKDGKLSDAELSAVSGGKAGKGDADREEKKARRAERKKSSEAKPADKPAEVK